MDRISSCATSSSSETRTVLSVPSGVANLSAIAPGLCLQARGAGTLFRSFSCLYWCCDWNLKRHRDEGKEKLLFIFNKNYNSSLTTLKITATGASMADK